ncbi:CDP-alcohol phosphatidyltransferase family protein [Leifsonia sp. NPDC077715]|uniref:CDP-alcohol phosphatidyltransferase family protein n=1 Tax=Leifsonia sp. NPDC077715 TaxID=3155539 RepID=UPI003443AF80
MRTVQREAIGWAALWGILVLPLAALAAGGVSAVPLTAWLIAAAYLIVTTLLLMRGLRRRGAVRFGLANAVTSLRSTLVGLITGLVVASFLAPIPVPLLVGLTVPALALDAVDGWVARRTHSTSELGARFDMEVDAFLLLVLSAYVARDLGLWVLTIGLLRYAFVAVGWMLPWFRARLPYRYWRKVVTAVAGIALALAVSGAPGPVAAGAVGVALALLLESFGRDAVWLVRQRTLAPAGLAWRPRRSRGRWPTP